MNYDRAFQKEKIIIKEQMDKVLAEVRKASYDAHIKQGFTPEQALELCKKIF